MRLKLGVILLIASTPFVSQGCCKRIRNSQSAQKGRAMALEAVGGVLKYGSYAAIPVVIGKSMAVTIGIDDTETPEQDFAVIVVAGLVANGLGRICRVTAKKAWLDLNERLPE